MRKDWLAPLTGAAFVVVAIVSFAVGGEPPDADDPVREIVAHYQDDKDAIQAGAAIAALAAVLLVFFGGVLRRALMAADGDGDRSVLPTVAFAGSVILAVGVTIDSTISFALSEAAGDVDPTAVQALQALWDNDFMPMAAGVALLMLAAGLSIVRSGGLPKPLGYVALVLGLVAVTPIGFAGFIGGALWIVVVSVLLTLRGRAEAGSLA